MSIDPAWRKEFDARREEVVNALRDAVESCTEVTCRPLDGDFTFSWMFEEGDTGLPDQTEGNMDYGIAYIRFMIDQGLYVAFGARISDGDALVCLKSWEDEEPSWPKGFERDVTIYSRPMTSPPGDNSTL